MQWKHYIAALAAKGVSQSQLAKQVGCGQATISDLASGKTLEPRHSLGVALIRVGSCHGIETPTHIAPSSRSKHPAPTSELELSQQSVAAKAAEPTASVVSHG